MEGGGDGGGVEVELRWRMAAQRAACQRQIAAARERAATSSDAFHAALLSARSLAQNTVSHREKLNGLKHRLRELESDLTEALSVKASKESKFELTRESILSTAATNEQLKILVMDQMNRRDEYHVVISNQLDALVALEVKSNEDAAGGKNIEEATIWYNKILGFQVVGGEGVKFIFNKIDLQSPEKEYSFCIKLDKDRYCLLQCDPDVKDSEELINHLNHTNDLFKFVRIMRERFQFSTVNVSSPLAISTDTRSEDMVDQSHVRSKTKSQSIPAKRRVFAQSASSPGTMVSGVRRSPRFAGIR